MEPTEGSKFVNSRETCMVCQTTILPDQLIKHHIRYYPELIAYVHYECHNKIHDPDNPLSVFIQYTRAESMQFYRQKNLEYEEMNDNIE